MNNLVAQITTAVDELAAELSHADALIAEQQARIEALERQVRLLQVLLDVAGAAA